MEQSPVNSVPSVNSILRQILSENPNMSTADILAKASAVGVTGIPLQKIYKVRSEIRSKNRRYKNDIPLRDYIRAVLKNGPQSISDIKSLILKSGYKSQKSTFRQYLNKRIRYMVQKHELEKIGNLYKLRTIAAPVTQVAVAKSINPEILLEINALCQKIGGVEELSVYLNTLKSLSPA